MTGPRILIVDDEVSNTELFSMMLKLEDYRPLVANSVSGAIETMNQEKPDAVILDIMMPGGSGLELCAYMRDNPRFASIPIVVVSAKTQLDDVQAGLDAGANIYLVKPVSKNELLEAVSLALRGSDEPESSTATG